MKHSIRLAAILLVLISTAACSSKKSAGESVDDTWIHTKVKTKLVGFGTSNFNLEVYHGVVLMAGFVRSMTEREAAEAQAASVKGVVRVSNQLVVQPENRSAGQTLDDGVIAGKVKAELADDERTGVHAGQTVKIDFTFAPESESKEGNETERMWVVVKERVDDHWIGVLDNDPRFHDTINSGHEFHFHPHHIVAIWRDS